MVVRKYDKAEVERELASIFGIPFPEIVENSWILKSNKALLQPSSLDYFVDITGSYRGLECILAYIQSTSFS